MAGFFVMQVDALVQTFSVMDAGTRIQFGMETQDNGAVFQKPDTGDWILGFVSAPIRQVRLVFQVVGKDGPGKLELVKKLEAEDGVRLQNAGLEEQLRREELCQLTAEQFQEIYEELVGSQGLGQMGIPGLSGGAGNGGMPAGSGGFTGDAGMPAGSGGFTGDGGMPAGSGGFAGDAGISSGSVTGALADKRALAAHGVREILGSDGRILETASGITAPRLPVPWNYLVFGAPGTGKSYLVTRLQKKYFPEQDSFERVTFYASYSYANFVGTYKPRMRGKEICYEFVPGPLIRVLEKAVKNPGRNFLLIVEEINRANAAAVFGDVFQLLDRKKGTSEYPVETSEDLKQYLASGYYGDFSEREDLQPRYLDSFGKLLIPSNLYIWATMNSADQGVFPMDTAFKRRWDFRYVGVDEEEGQVESVCFLAPSRKDETDRVSWNRLRKAVNARLSRECRVNEDKLLGPFFLSGEVLERDESGMIVDNDGFLEAFKSKILMYLFEDAARQARPRIFPGCEDCGRYSAVCEAFDRIGIRIFGDQVYGEAVEPSGRT